MEQNINHSKTGKGKNRKPYIKPQVSKVILAGKEAVLASGCKGLATGSANGLDTDCNVPTCALNGS